MDATIRVRTVVGFVGAVFAVMLALVVLMWAWQADAAPGDTDATLVPITPCRLIDTRVEFRVGAFDAFGADETKTIVAHGTNGKCVIPTDAVGLSLNVTALGATQPSFLTIWPDGSRPDASSLNPVPGQPPIPNAVVTNLSAVGEFRIYNLDGSVQVIVDVNGYYTKTSLQDLDDRLVALETTGVDQSVLDRLDALESKVTALESANTAQQAKIDALEIKTASMSVETVDGQPTVRFSNVNVQVVDGSGDTDGAVNGRGNLIVGYNENSSDTRTGSHNLIVGDRHSYTSFGGVVFGSNNTISGTYASVTGGVGNTASGGSASVSGGNGNTASGGYASVSGGAANTASGSTASVSGGGNNTASGSSASVSGGFSNLSSSGSASVSGGVGNTASGGSASVSGGVGNTASGGSASVSGGDRNTASGFDDTVAGGDNVVCNAAGAVVCGEGSITPAD
jgi:hypothetical protein